MLFQFMDSNGTNSLSINEYKLHFGSQQQREVKTSLSSELQQQIINIFNEIDVNKDQTVSKQELEDTFNSIGIKLSEKEMDEYYDYLGISQEQALN